MKNGKRKHATAAFGREGRQLPGLIDRRKLLHLAAGASAVLATSPLAWSQGYPFRPITIVVGCLAGFAGG
jgi:hypothetical protein